MAFRTLTICQSAGRLQDFSNPSIVSAMRSCSSAFFCDLVSSCQTSTAIRTFQSRWMLYDSTKSKQDQESTYRTIQPSCDLFYGGTMGREEAQYCITCQDRADGDHR